MNFKMISPGLGQAMVEYWEHRNGNAPGFWKPIVDIKNVETAARKQTPKIISMEVRSITVSADTFFFTWGDNVTTIHNRNDWKECKRFDGKKVKEINFEF